MGHIFISYSHKDKEYVHRLAEALQSEGFDIWIDDRIDYGTRWPLVIEDAIDTCESFILVASQNSHQSKWVQHEVSRAERLSKNIFPLLLDGEAWLSFEAIQYFDVRDGKLPDRKFHTALRKVQIARFAFLREYTTASWPTYRNEHHGFSVRYPSEGKFAIVQDDFIQIDLPVLKGTDISERSLWIHCKDDGDLSSEVIWHLPWTNQRGNIDVLGLNFLRESGEDGSMSRRHELLSFSTQRQSKVISLSFHLATYSPEVFGLGPGVLVQIDRAAAKEVLLGVVSSFTWLD
jgi:hypothetical protein